MSDENHINKFDFDLLILGGGINALGIAAAACKRNLHKELKIALIEKEEELAANTSANSLRIIHGGLRYLQKLDLVRSIRSLVAQSYLVRRFPKIIKPYRCCLPLKKHGLKSRYPAFFAGLFYGLLQKLCASRLSTPQVDFKNNLFYWYDAYLEDHHSLVEYYENFLSSKITILKAEEVERVELSQDIVRVSTSKNQYNVGNVINALASGNENLEISGEEDSKQLFWTSAYNLVFDHPKLLKAINCAVAYENNEKRMLFFTPRADQLAVGTFYAKSDQLEDEVVLQAIDEIQSAVPDGFPEKALFSVENIQSIERGLLPASLDTGKEADLMTKPLIRQNGLYTLAVNTKYTTFLRFGEKVINQIF